MCMLLGRLSLGALFWARPDGPTSFARYDSNTGIISVAFSLGGIPQMNLMVLQPQHQTPLSAYQYHP
jgi:hypothetical protein